MMKLGGRCIVQKSPPSSNLGVIAPRGCAPPQNVALGYDVGIISADCLFAINIKHSPEQLSGIYCVSSCVFLCVFVCFFLLCVFNCVLNGVFVVVYCVWYVLCFCLRGVIKHDDDNHAKLAQE